MMDTQKSALQKLGSMSHQINDVLYVKPRDRDRAAGESVLRGQLKVRMIAVLVVVVTVCMAGCGASSDPPAVARNETVVLLPALSAGEAGWCLLTLRVAAEGGGCPATGAGSPIVAETWHSGAETVGLDLTSGEVAAVSFDGGAPLPTRAERVLPDHLRAVAWAMPGETPESAGFPPPDPTPLDKQGHALQQTSYGVSRSIGGRGLLFEVPNNKIGDAADPPPGPCVIKATHLSRLVVQGAYAISTVKAYSGLIGEAFLACIHTKYALAGWPMGASVLIDAARPGLAPPRLPLMKAVPGRADVFEEPGQLGSQVARRVQGGWLVVWGGKTQAQRLTLLAHLRATGPPA
jgi:hypothetical protein